jgi:hypothetical protein
VRGRDCCNYRTKENHNDNYIALMYLSMISTDNPSSDPFIHIISVEGYHDTNHAAMPTKALVLLACLITTIAIGLTINNHALTNQAQYIGRWGNMLDWMPFNKHYHPLSTPYNDLSSPLPVTNDVTKQFLNPSQLCLRICVQQQYFIYVYVWHDTINATQNRTQWRNLIYKAVENRK